MKHNEKGEEIPDNTPVEIPSRLRMPPTRAEEILHSVRTVVSQMAEARGYESFEDANDFDVDDDDDPLSPYQKSVMKVEDAFQRDADAAFLDSHELQSVERRERIAARRDKERREHERRTKQATGADGGAGAFGAGERAHAASGASDGVHGARGDGEGGGGSEGRSSARSSAARGGGA